MKNGCFFERERHLLKLFPLLGKRCYCVPCGKRSNGNDLAQDEMAARKKTLNKLRILFSISMFRPLTLMTRCECERKWSWTVTVDHNYMKNEEFSSFFVSFSLSTLLVCIPFEIVHKRLLHQMQMSTHTKRATLVCSHWSEAGGGSLAKK